MLLFYGVMNVVAAIAVPASLEARAVKGLGDGAVIIATGPEEHMLGTTYAQLHNDNPKLDKLATGKLELEVKDLTAWGPELNGLQAGLGYRFGEQRAYAHGEEVKIVLRVRNVGKEAVELKRNGGYFIENPPTITNGDGKKVELKDSLGKVVLSGEFPTS